jgi:hypothetical protein
VDYLCEIHFPYFIRNVDYLQNFDFNIHFINNNFDQVDCSFFAYFFLFYFLNFDRSINKSLEFSSLFFLLKIYFYFF